MDKFFYLSPQMIIMATAHGKDFSLLPEYLTIKAHQHLVESGLMLENDDVIDECVNHLDPEGFDLQTSTIIRMVKAICEWESARELKNVFDIENKVSAIIAHALHASGMTHHEITEQQAIAAEDKLREIMVKKEVDRQKIKAGVKQSTRTHEKQRKELEVLREYKRLKEKRPGQERTFASIIAKKVGYKDPRNVREIIKNGSK